MSIFRLLLLLFPLTFSLALGEEKELFEPLPNPEKTWDHYTTTFFPKVKKGAGVLHFVTYPSLKKTINCLSIVREQTEEGNRYYLFARKLSRDDGDEQESQRLEISVNLSSSLQNFSSAALRFTAAAPAKPKGLDGTSTLLFVDSYRRPVGRTNSPDRKSVPAQVLRFFESLREDVQDGMIDEKAWIDHARTIKKGLPSLPWYPTYSESKGAESLRKELEVMSEWGVTHQIRYLDLNGFKDLESIRFRRELVESLAKIAPKEWKELMKSSGNMHNPKVHPIHAFMDEATVRTPSAQQIDQVLAEYGLKVSGISFEKLSFATKTNAGLPSAMMHFEVARKGE